MGTQEQIANDVMYRSMNYIKEPHPSYSMQGPQAIYKEQKGYDPVKKATDKTNMAAQYIAEQFFKSPGAKYLKH